MEDLNRVIKALLGRDTVPADNRLMSDFIGRKSVMVTGAGGSIGTELCRELVKFNPKNIILFERSELALYTVENEIREMYEALDGAACINIVQILGSITDKALVANVIKQFEVDTIYHAAAYKQVPMLERNVVAGIENNVFGTLVLAKAAIKYKVNNFIFISTDKAVRPANIMGATKRIAEQILQALDAIGSQTCFSMVRFGNVMGSSGSVIPLFRKQILMGGPVTVTHPEVERYFMTASEAAQLVLHAGVMARGGEVFVLDMNEPIRIAEMAKKMIALMGFEVCEDCSFDTCTCTQKISLKYTGLREGEKLVEELLIGKTVAGTSHPKIMRVIEDFQEWSWMESLLTRLEFACKRPQQNILRAILNEAVEGIGLGNKGQDHDGNFANKARIPQALQAECFEGEDITALSH